MIETSHVALSLALGLMLLSILGVLSASDTPVTAQNAARSQPIIHSVPNTPAGPIYNLSAASATDDAENRLEPALTNTLYLPFAAISEILPPQSPLQPPAHDYAAPISGTISIVCEQPIDPTTVTSRTFVVHGSQTGMMDGTYWVEDSVIFMKPKHVHKYGEEIVATSSDAIQKMDGTPLKPFGWRFRTMNLPTVVGGTGRLEPHPTTPSFGLGSGYIVNDLAIGDLDGDGDLDVIEAGANWFDDTESVWLNDGLGNLSPHPDQPTFGGGWSQAIALGDLDSDGDLDAVVANSTPPSC